MKWITSSLAVSLVILTWPARALIINAVYDSSVTSQPNAAQIEAAYGVVTQAYSALFTNNITLNITVVWGKSGFGNSSDSLVGHPSYIQLTNALKAAETIPADISAVASLPDISPIASTNVWWIPRAEAKALPSLGTLFGVGGNDTTQDGEVMFASNGIAWDFGPTNRAAIGEYDFIAVAEHETSEVMGRCFDLDHNPTNGYVPYDLFRFTNGVRTLNVFDSGVYFSANNGVTPLKYFNAVTQPPISSDPQDWMPATTPDPYDYALGSDTEALLSSPDLTVMSVLGYNLNFKPPKLAGTALSNGNFRLTFTNVTGMNFSVLASTNVSTPVAGWQNLGAPSEPTLNNYEFTDTQAGDKARFYMVILQ